MRTGREGKRTRADSQLSRMITMADTVNDAIDPLLSFNLAGVSLSASQG